MGSSATISLDDTVVEVLGDHRNLRFQPWFLYGRHPVFTTWNLFSKNSPTYPWNIPQIPNQQFMKEFLSFAASGMPGGMLQGYVAVLLDI